MMMAAAVELIYGLIITGRLHLFEQGEGGGEQVDIEVGEEV